MSQNPKRLRFGNDSAEARELALLLNAGKAESPTEPQMASLANKLGLAGAAGGVAVSHGRAYTLQ
jgi:hypothetical protein